MTGQLGFQDKNERRANRTIKMKVKYHAFPGNFLRHLLALSQQSKNQKSGGGGGRGEICLKLIIKTSEHQKHC